MCRSSPPRVPVFHDSERQREWRHIALRAECNVLSSRRVKNKKVELPVSRYRVQVLDRTIAVLQAVADADRDLAAAEIARQLRLHKSTVHRLLVVLEHYRLIKKGPEGTYRLGTRLIELGECAIARLKLSERAESFLRDIANQTGEGAHVTILSGTEMLSVAHVEGRWSLQSLTRTGQRTHIHCTAAGKAVLAFMPEEACDDLIAKLSMARYTPRTLVKPTALKMNLIGVRDAGFAIDDEEFEEGLRCVGAPVFDHRGHVIASISMAAPVFRLRKERVPQVARIVMTAARGLSAELGYQEPVAPVRIKTRRPSSTSDSQ
jgi:IclR family transcriptional regulator, KDG regulon repressor